IANMFSGSIADGIYNPYVLYTEKESTPFVPQNSTMFGAVQTATIDLTKSHVEKDLNFDINRDGKIDATITIDQLRRARNTATMPGAVEFHKEYSGTSAIESDASAVTVNVLGGTQICISAPESIGAITATDLTGRMVTTVNTADTEYTIDMAGLQRGIYIINCCGNAYKILTK
ncbi:MAG: T9SS type A sorting domain-containing protein, partial [Muribaculaceae bacterium]|nr:T9SS type A sorting domain-containing protein [Muribaculaceae bacterium]